MGKYNFYYFVFQALKELLTCSILCLSFGFLKIFILCASLSLNFESRKNASWRDCSMEKKPHRENAYSTFCIPETPPMKINPQH